MKKLVLIADDSSRDSELFQSALAAAGFSPVLCNSGEKLARQLDKSDRDVAAIILYWDLPGIPSGPELLLKIRRSLPDVPVALISDALDETIALRAIKLGVKAFAERPLRASDIEACLGQLFAPEEVVSPLVKKLNERMLGESKALQSVLNQIAKIIEHKASRVLIIGASGTGKELVARSIHDFGADPDQPFVAVNVAAIPPELIESQLFGHEKGSFTGATGAHRGYLEEAGRGTLFLDELGELEKPLQIKLLRVFQENKFRRITGTQEIDFDARVVCATNVDVPQAVNSGAFRLDLFFRLTEATIKLPLLNERSGDVDLLVDHFLEAHNGGRNVHFSRAALSILRKYPFPGNVRELDNIVKSALIQCDGEAIQPQHLPLSDMSALIAKSSGDDDTVTTGATGPYDELFTEVAKTLPHDWKKRPYRQLLEQWKRALGRIYLSRLIERNHYNVTRAAKEAGIDKKTFLLHWRDAGLAPLRSTEDEAE